MIIKNWDDVPVDLIYSKRLADAIRIEVPHVEAHTLSGIYSSAAELISNIINHANLEKDSSCFSMSLRWTDNGQLAITISDFGISIPQSMLNKLAESLRPSLPNVHRRDSLLIDIAITGQGNEPGRGQGLQSIVSLVKKNVFAELNIKSRRGGFSIQGSALPIIAEMSDLHRGTAVEVVVKINRPREEKKDYTEISVAKDFSEYPAGRFTSESEFSGQAFLEKILFPALDSYNIVTIDLDGVFGYPGSFLEEAFGGLVRKGYMANELEGRLNIISKTQLHVTHQIWTYIRGARI
jgi:hypothetical protein